MENIIEIRDLKKTYKSVEAVKGISFSVKAGSFFAFLGENGAGKSTTINMIVTLLKKTSGHVMVNGNVLDENDSAIRKDIGVVFQNSMLDDFLTVRENIINRGKMYHLSKSEIEERLKTLSEKIGLEGFIDRQYKSLSGGQKRRSDIARALINKPKVLILDEPTTGLDPKTRMAVWEMIKNLKQETGLTVFLTTHYMEEAAQADHIVIINSGLIKAQGTPEQLRRKYSSDKLIVIAKIKEHMIERLYEMGLEGVMLCGESISIALENSMQAIDILLAVRNDIDGFEVIQGNMDDVFINALAQ